jgi:hypothetical protein
MDRKTILIIVGVLAVVCLCIMGVGLFALNRAGNWIRQSTSTDPVQIAQTASEIADYTLPQGYQEAIALSIFNTTMVGFTREDSTMTIFMLQMPVNSRLSSEQMKEQMQKAIEAQTGRRYDLKYVGSQNVTIRGQGTEMFIYEGTSDQGELVRQMMGIFEGKNGTAWLMVMGNPDTWDQVGVDAFIRSLR